MESYFSGTQLAQTTSTYGVLTTRQYWAWGRGIVR